MDTHIDRRLQCHALQEELDQTTVALRDEHSTPGALRCLPVLLTPEGCWVWAQSLNPHVLEGPTTCPVYKASDEQIKLARA